jgi:radical SAM-linked protein
MTPQEFEQQLTAQLPAGIELMAISAIDPKQAALMASVDHAAYTIVVPLAVQAGTETAESSVAAFNEASNVIYTKQTPKGAREIDVKNYLALPVTVTIEAHQAKLTLLVKITPTGSIKPTEVLDVLTQQFGLLAFKDAAIIERDGLYMARNGQLLSPLIG